MALTITATVDPSSLAVRLTITGGAPEYTVTASPAADRAAYVVRSTYTPITGDPTGRVALDGDAPLNIPTQYVVTDRAGAQAQSAVVTPTSDVPVLSDATDPTRALTVTVQAQPPNVWEGRSVWWDVLGRREPFASIAPMRLRAGELVLYTETRAERAALVAMMATGHPLVLRAVCPAAVDDVVLLPIRVTDELVMESHPSGPRLHRVEYQAVSRELGPYAVDPGRMYSSLPLEAPAYRDLPPMYIDYRALLAGKPYAGLGPDLIVNGGFTSALTGWGLFWTSQGMAWDTSAGTALSRNDGTEQAGYSNLNQILPGGIPTGPRLLRVTGRVRSTAQGTGVYAQLWTNTAPEPPQPFAPGVASTQKALTAGPAWRGFAVDLAVPNPAHDTAAVFLRADAMVPGAIVEWDDITARWQT